MTGRPLDPNLESILASIRESVTGAEPAMAQFTPPAFVAPVAQPAAPATAVGPSLEAFMAAIAEPHVKAWLDAHLAEIVQRQVAAAVERLVGA